MAEELFFAGHDRSNALHKEAFDLHMQMHRRLLRRPRGKVVVRVSSPVVVEAVAAHRALDAEHKLRVLECKVAEVQVEESRLHILRVIGTETGQFPDEDEAIDIQSLCIRKKDWSNSRPMRLKRAVELAKEIAESNGDGSAITPESVCSGSVPAELQDDEMLTAFLVDLCRFMVTEGGPGRQLVAKIIDDPTFAQHLLADSAAELDTPVRALCSFTAQMRSSAADMLEPEKQVPGFSTA